MSQPEAARRVEPNRWAGHLGPRSIERPADFGATPVAVLDNQTPYLVDGGGLVQPPGASWALDWWIGADDRWYAPCREASVRQRRRGAGPILDTSVRVPSGDVVHTVYAATVGGRQVAVIEVDNQSPVPVALAFALRPYDWLGTVRRFEPRRRSATEFDIDGVRLTVPRPPNECGLSGLPDLWETVTSGDSLTWTGEIEAGNDRGEFVNGLVMFPLPHRSALRICLGPSDLSVRLDAVPGPDNVGKGWDTVVGAGGRFEFPDPGVTALAGAARARLLLADSRLGDRLVESMRNGRKPLVPRWMVRRPAENTNRPRATARDAANLAGAEVLAALAESGHPDQPARWMPPMAEAVLTSSFAGTRHGSLSRMVEALARTVVLINDVASAELLLEPLARLTKRLEPANGDGAGPWIRAAEGLLMLADLMGQAAAAAELRSRLQAVGGPSPSGADHRRLTTLAEAASSSGRWPPAPLAPNVASRVSDPDDLVAAAVFWRAARSRLLRERVTAAEPTVDLVPDFPASWRGGSVDVHQAATLYGPVSFAIRWHGARPALLWDQGAGSATLVCPALDPDWQTTESRGETLLAGSADGLIEVPGPGDSFR